MISKIGVIVLAISLTGSVTTLIYTQSKLNNCENAIYKANIQGELHQSLNDQFAEQLEKDIELQIEILKNEHN